MNKFLIRASIVLIGLGILAVVAFYLFLKSQRKAGEEMWQAALAEFEADGESLVPASRFATAIPDETNFGAIPLLRHITADNPVGGSVRAALEELDLEAEQAGWSKKKRSKNRDAHRRWQAADLESLHVYLSTSDRLSLEQAPVADAAAMRRAIEAEFGEQLTALYTAALTRPQAQFVPPLSDVYPPGAPIIVENLAHLDATQSLSKLAKLHSTLCLYSEDANQAAAGVQTQFKLASAFEADGKCLLTYLVANAIYRNGIQVTWEGLRERSFDANQLEQIEARLLSIDPLHSLTDAVRGELVAILLTVDAIEEDPSELLDDPDQKARMPRFISVFFDHNRALILETLHQSVIKPSKAATPYMEMRAQGQLASQRFEEFAEDRRYFLAALILPATSSLAKHGAKLHASIHQATIACMLERYLIKHGSYPDTLQALVPEFGAKLPLDPIDQQPMRYQQTAGGRYQLHSVGWDGVDDGGAETDIVWGYETAAP